MKKNIFTLLLLAIFSLTTVASEKSSGGSAGKSSSSQNRPSTIKIKEDSFVCIKTAKNKNTTLYSDNFSGCLGILYTGLQQGKQKIALMGHFNKNINVMKSFMEKLKSVHAKCSDHKVIIFGHEDIKYYMDKWSQEGSLSKKIKAVRKNLLEIMNKINSGNQLDVVSTMIEQYQSKYPNKNIDQKTIELKKYKASDLEKLKRNINEKLATINHIITIMNIQKMLSSTEMLPLIFYKNIIQEIHPVLKNIWTRSNQRFGLSLVANEHQIEAYSYLDFLYENNSEHLHNFNKNIHNWKEYILKTWPETLVYFKQDQIDPKETPSLWLSSGISDYISIYGACPYNESEYYMPSSNLRKKIIATRIYMTCYYNNILQNHGGNLVRQIL